MSPLSPLQVVSAGEGVNARPRWQRLWWIYLTVGVLIVSVLVGWAVWQASLPPPYICGTEKVGQAICATLALGGGVNVSSEGSTVYAFPIESAAPKLFLTDVIFEVKDPTGALVPVENVCVAGANATVIGTWSGVWATSGGSTSCSAAATRSPEKAAFTTMDIINVYLNPDLTGVAGYSFWVLGSVGSVGDSF
jgi:hypothetical protein